MTSEGRSEGARELVLAIFRLAVADYLGHSYSHDMEAPVRVVANRFSSDAATFLQSKTASYLADLIALQGPAIWREARLFSEPAAVGRAREPAA